MTAAPVDGRRFVSPVHQMTSLFVNAGNYHLWPHFGRALLRRLRVTGPGEGEDGSAIGDWCDERAVDTMSALRHLGAVAPPTTLPERFPDIWQEAKRRIEECLVPFQDLGIAGGADVELLYWLCRHIRAHRILETGVALGWSSLALLLAMADDPAAQLRSVDLPYTRLRAGKWVGIAVPPRLRQGWTIYRMADREGLPRALAHGPFDLCHYDSDKSVEGRLWAYPKMWEALRPGGFLISDDIGDNHALRTFCACVDQPPIVVGTESKHVGILVKAR